MRNIKRTVRKYGKPIGHRYGAYSTQILNYFEARMLIYLPTYKYVLDNIPEVRNIIDRIRERAKTNVVILLDYNTNSDYRDTTKPLSHAELVKLYIEGNYPVYDSSIQPLSNDELKDKKKNDRKRKKEVKDASSHTPTLFD